MRPGYARPPGPAAPLTLEARRGPRVDDGVPAQPASTSAVVARRRRAGQRGWSANAEAHWPPRPPACQAWSPPSSTATASWPAHEHPPQPPAVVGTIAVVHHRLHVVGQSHAGQPDRQFLPAGQRVAPAEAASAPVLSLRCSLGRQTRHAECALRGIAGGPSGGFIRSLVQSNTSRRAPSACRARSWSTEIRGVHGPGLLHFFWGIGRGTGPQHGGEQCRWQ